VFLTVLAACTHETAEQLHPPPSPVRGHGKIVGMWLAPQPDGPVSPQFLQNAASHDPPGIPLTTVERYLPRPLPAPLDQQGCTTGGDLIVQFADHYRLSYGPCNRPRSINRLWAQMVYADPSCRPACGPNA
jgi:hypothetical protein